MPKTLMLVFSSPISAAQETAYNAWYTDKHLPDICAIPGVISATRYKIDKSVALMPGLPADPNAYLAVYELEAKTSAELEVFAQAMREALQQGRADLSPLLDLAHASSSFAVPITTRLLPLA
ncbi:hypothetical protein GCM10010909_18350 [Acidocella aquatica]|uniref:EthD domain-containing protein n=1 Tax=Acidocella aquatica TaxID=1922313 RepID=A0ABQ6AAJ4_9PROT|nr:DUF4286 family protein [Acidocella aquatica]GLR67154.1 hypothetical protein GCM10010909_18350 [Acidocella aquatica]